MCVLQLIVIIIIAELNDGQPNVIRTNKMLCGAAFLLWTCALGDDANKNTHVQDKWHGLSWTLQIGLPLTGLAFFLIYGGFLPSLLLQIDRCCVSVFCPSLSKREKLLRWVSNRLPWTWSFRTRPLTSGVPELWKDGSLLCTLINSAIPGACPNPHRHWKKPPLHAQALAYKYLDLAPVFFVRLVAQKARLERQRKISDDHQIKLNLSANVNEEQQPLKIQLEPQPKSTNNPNIEEKPLKKILSSDNIFYVDYEETDGSSPICAEQIAKEENVPSAKQRRKLFQFPQPEFSHAENGDTMETEDSCFNSLNSTLSLPEISTVKERKAFWEQKIRSSTESLDKEVPDKNLFQNIRHREKVNKYQIELMSKSNEECNSIKDFEIFNLMSLEDRKKMLLEKMDKADKRKTKNSIKKLNVERMESFDEVDHETISPKEVFEPISERIDRFDKNNLPNQNQKNDRKKRNNFKAHFKRAFNFFRSLEESPKRNNTRSIMQPIQRRHSLDTHVNNLKGNNKVRKGGSLSERFSINNLFDDVFGSWNKGSFKGTPNKQAVIRSLSSFGESPDALVISNRIQYNLFANKNKARRRKSLKSIFDVNY